MSNDVAFHTQIASIMEVLANAAVAEICKLVDDGYVEFRLEMSQSQKENRTLKRKLQLMELRFARERAERTMRERILNCRSGGTRTLDRIRGAPRGTVDAVSDGGERIPSMDTQPGTMDSGRGRKNTTSGRSCSFSTERKADNASVCPETKPAPTADGSPGSSGPSDCLDVKSDVLIVDTVPVKVEECVSLLSLNKMTDSRSSQPSCHNFLGHMESIEPTPDIIVVSSPSHALTNNASVSKVAPTDSNRHVPYDQIFTVSEMANEHSFKSKEHLPLHSAPNEMEAGDSVWKTDASLEMGHTQPGRIIESRETEERQGYAASFRSGADATASGMVAVFGEGAPVPTEGYSSATPKKDEPSHREKRFFCLHCGRSFRSVQLMEDHQRIHIGQRPYACTQCGKSFNRAANLRSHQRIHTGEKPFVCTQCGKTFNHVSNLKTHQRIHTGDRPYVCSLCGLDFSYQKTLNSHNRKMHPANDWTNPL